MFIALKKNKYRIFFSFKKIEPILKIFVVEHSYNIYLKSRSPLNTDSPGLVR